jgi:hypothetical protein
VNASSFVASFSRWQIISEDYRRKITEKITDFELSEKEGREGVTKYLHSEANDVVRVL